MSQYTNGEMAKRCCSMPYLIEGNDSRLVDFRWFLCDYNIFD